MSGARTVTSLLHRNGIEFDVIKHDPVYTSHDLALAMGVPAVQIAKPVILKIDGYLVMIVLPGNCDVDLDSLQHQLGTHDLYLADEDEFIGYFQDCLPGAEPPFGELYNMEVIVDETLTWDEEIFFNAGTHTEVIRMNYIDYEDLVRPRILSFSLERNVSDSHAA